MPHLPIDIVAEEDALRAAGQALDALQGMEKSVAFSGLAIASFMCFRGATTIDEDMSLLEEYSQWLVAFHAEGST